MLHDQLREAACGWSESFLTEGLVNSLATVFVAQICTAGRSWTGQESVPDLKEPGIVHALQFTFDLICAQFALSLLYGSHRDFVQDFPLVSRCFTPWPQWQKAFFGLADESQDDVFDETEISELSPELADLFRTLKLSPGSRRARRLFLLGLRKGAFEHLLAHSVQPFTGRAGRLPKYLRPSPEAFQLPVGAFPALGSNPASAPLVNRVYRDIRNLRTTRQCTEAFKAVSPKPVPKEDLRRVRFAFAIHAINLGFDSKPPDSVLQRACLHIWFAELVDEEEGLSIFPKGWVEDPESNLETLSEWNRKHVAGEWGYAKYSPAHKAINEEWRTETRALMRSFQELRSRFWLMYTLLELPSPNDILFQELVIPSEVSRYQEWFCPTLDPIDFGELAREFARNRRKRPTK